MKAIVVIVSALLSGGCSVVVEFTEPDLDDEIAVKVDPDFTNEERIEIQAAVGDWQAHGARMRIRFVDDGPSIVTVHRASHDGHPCYRSRRTGEVWIDGSIREPYVRACAAHQLGALYGVPTIDAVGVMNETDMATEVTSADTAACWSAGRCE